MRKHFLAAIAAAVIIGVFGATSFAAPSFLGITGNILTPDDVLLSPGSFSAHFHSLDVSDFDTQPTIFGANFGVTPSLELGISAFDPDAGDSEMIINGKYQILAETPNRPSIVFGTADLTGDMNIGDDANLFILLGKNLTPVATEVAGEPSKPLRGVIGFGTGIYGDIFAALNWTLTPKISLIAEFVNDAEIKGVVNDSTFNFGARFALTNELRGDLALINGDFGFGVSYTKLSF